MPEHESAQSASTQPAPSARAGTRGGRQSGPRFYAGGFWRRLGAAAIDLAVIVPVALLLSWLAGQLTGVHLPDARHYGIDFWLDLLLAGEPALMTFLGLLTVTAVVYALVFQLTWAATLGMRVLHLHIIDLYGDAPSLVRAVARTAGYLAATVTLGLGFLWIGFDSERRGLHDWLSGTHVVRG
ncbi:RDD family protein [Haliangium sp.]|uniref:RDD family protein n=1 Tax=Haliangium sp. TaxID=2663208 RepID=UPI003D132CAE